MWRHWHRHPYFHPLFFIVAVVVLLGFLADAVWNGRVQFRDWIDVSRDEDPLGYFFAIGGLCFLIALFVVSGVALKGDRVMWP